MVKQNYLNRSIEGSISLRSDQSLIIIIIEVECDVSDEVVRGGDVSDLVRGAELVPHPLKMHLPFP